MSKNLQDTDDMTPVGYFDDGCPRYAPTEVDARFDVLLDRYAFVLGDPYSDRMAVANAFQAVVAQDNLAHAAEAVHALRRLVEQDAAPFEKALLRYDIGPGPISDRLDIGRGFEVIAAPENSAHAAKAVDVLQDLVDQTRRRVDRWGRTHGDTASVSNGPQRQWAGFPNAGVETGWTEHAAKKARRSGHDS